MNAHPVHNHQVAIVGLVALFDGDEVQPIASLLQGVLVEDGSYYAPIIAKVFESPVLAVVEK